MKNTDGWKELAKNSLNSVGLMDSAYKIRDLLRVLRAYPQNRAYMRTRKSGDIALPPASLVAKVAGIPDVRIYEESGLLAAQSIHEILKDNGILEEHLHSILDFGCGCGRAIRYLRFGKQTNLSGSDMNPSLIRWCQEQLPFAEFQTNNLNPPLPFPNDRFDLVYALSVFTHLPENIQFEWIGELSRVLKPGGLFIFSTHGEHYLKQLDKEEQMRFLSGKMVIQTQGPAGSNRFAAYHPPAYVRKKLAKRFEVIDFIPEGALGNPRQDLYLLRSQSPI